MKEFLDSKGFDFFVFKAYVEETIGFETGVWKVLQEIIVNLFFVLLSMIAYLLYLLLKVFESFSIYDLYKQYVYDSSKELWQYIIGEGSGRVTSNSIFYILLSVSLLYLFCQYAFARGNFVRSVLHLMAVLTIGFGYFGTIQGTDGGLFVLDQIRSLSKEAVSQISKVSFQLSEEGQSVSSSSFDFSETYLTETVYETFLYVNTGRIDGSYYNSQTEQLEEFEISKVIGTVDESGNFRPISSKDRNEYIDEIGNGANDNSEKNRWVSAVADFIFLKLFYVISTIVEAILLPIPVLVVYFFQLIAELLILALILVVPFALIASFIPRLQDTIFGVVKLMLVSSVFPTTASLILLLVAMVNQIVSNSIVKALSLTEEGAGALLVSNLAGTIISFIVYWLAWKYKSTLLAFFGGSLGRHIDRGFDGFHLPERAPDRNTYSEDRNELNDNFKNQLKVDIYERLLFSHISPEEFSWPDDYSDSPDLGPDITDVQEPSLDYPDSPEPEPATPDVQEPSPNYPDGPEPEPATPDVQEPSPDYPDSPDLGPDITDVQEPSPNYPDSPEPEPATPDVQEPSPDYPDSPEPEPATPDVQEPSPDYPDSPEPDPDTSDVQKPSPDYSDSQESSEVYSGTPDSVFGEVNA